jgi:hypothetical protein
MACQFGRRTIPSHQVSAAGDRLVCMTPPFSRPSGGFTAVGITITQTRGGGRGGAAQGGGRAVVSPRGAQSCEYVPVWAARAVRPSEVGVGTFHFTLFCSIQHPLMTAGMVHRHCVDTV